MEKFKQGDKIRMVEDKDYVVTVEKVTKNGYELSNRFKVYFKEESDWELDTPSEPSTQTKEESVEEIMAEAKKLLKNCDQLDKELDAMKQGKEFLLHEYKTNKRWFRVEGGSVTVEDVIKACFEFGWASHRNYEYDQREAKEVKTMEVNEDTERESIYGFINNAINIEDEEVYKITITKE